MIANFWKAGGKYELDIFCSLILVHLLGVCSRGDLCRKIVTACYEVETTKGK
jgi:hypothetical protein